MILRLSAFVTLIYAIGFIVFAMTLPGPVGHVRTDAVLVVTGGPGRIPRGLEVMRAGDAHRLFVSGVDPEVTRAEFARQFKVSTREMRCCVTLGHLAVDTRSNAGEAAQWMESNGVKSVRLVTTDWHMRRAAGELHYSIPKTIRVIDDAVPSDPSLGQLYLEYNKLIVSTVTQGWPL